ncbi:DegV family protein [Gordonibacter sp. 28C]|uniref:DegV family protein n=1 Tax=Gordonibacter sp. 28C TaxID=2078569 RepID=UPI000DF78C46|nr:DegV family protein [Gordonibacter sp. 28C]RDB59305.1 DegV family protein [Gordonibacter sp. 28C]
MEPNRIALVVDSCTDVPPEDVERYGMYVVPLQVNYEHETYLDKVTITPQQVYDRFAEEVPTTSTPTPAVAREVLERVAADGYGQAVVVTISSGLSATYDLMRSVASGMAGLECAIVDTKNIGMGAGLVALAVARMLASGATLDDVRRESQRIVEDTKVFFCVDTLEYLHKGGRIGNVTYAVGSLLDMRPVITCNEQGVYTTVTKAKGRRQSLKKAMAVAEKFAAGFARCTMAVVNGDAVEEAAAVRAELGARVSNVDTWYEGQISPVLVVHTGPGLIGIGVQGER